jgi:CRISPR-associated protein Cas2
LVSYDIRDQARWRQVYKLMRGSGERIQYSLFRCHLNKTEVERLRWELEKVLAEEDDFLIIHLCHRCAARVVVRRENSDWMEPRPRFEVAPFV